jgi:hypothetical protein
MTKDDWKMIEAAIESVVDRVDYKASGTTFDDVVSELAADPKVREFCIRQLIEALVEGHYASKDIAARDCNRVPDSDFEMLKHIPADDGIAF